MRESEKYLCMPNWVKYIGGGINSRSGTLAVICSFCRDASGKYTKKCTASTELLRNLVGCSRRQLFRELHYLQEAGYIIGKKGKSKTDIVTYTVNVMNCEKAMNDYDEMAKTNTYDAQSQAYDAQSQAYDAQSQAYDAQSQELMTDRHPISININTGINTRVNRESARAQNAEPWISIQGYERIKLTQSQYDRLQIEAKEAGKSIECYLRKLDYQMEATGKSLEPHCKKILVWIQEDKDKANQSSKAKPEAAEDSSIDMQLLEKIMYGDFGAVEDPA